MTESLTETQFQAQVVELARICGWRVLHVRRSIGKGQRWTTTTSIVGWPDCLFYRPRTGEHFAAELKTDDPKSQLSPEQVECLDELAASGVEVHVWRPADWDAIQQRLGRRDATR